MQIQNQTHLSNICVQVQCLPEKLKMCGQFEDSIDSIATLNNIGVRHLQSSNYEEALGCFQAALNRLDNNLSYMKFSSLLCMSLSMNCWRAAQTTKNSKCESRREYDEGMHFFSSPVRMEGPILDMIDVKTTSTVVLYNFGQLCLLSHKDAEATECFVRALFFARCAPKTRPVTAVAILHNIGYIQYRNSELEKALGSFNEVLQLSCRMFSDRLELAATLNCLGVIYFHLNKSDTSRAMENFIKALNIRMHIITKEDKEVATILNNIGRVHYMKGEYDLALARYLEALRIRRSLLGKDHLDVAATMYNAGQTFYHQGDLDKALIYYQEFKRIVVPKLGQSHRDVAIMLKCMAQIHHERGQYEKAILLYEDALNTGWAVLGSHAEVASILNKMGNLYYECGSLSDALDRYKKGLEVERAVFHDLHPNIAVTLTNIGQIHKQRGEYTAALKL